MTIAEPVKRLRKRSRDFHHGDLRAAAIEMTYREIDRIGHRDVSLDRIATRLGVTRPALYRHFEDKSKLLAEVAQRGWEAFEAAMTAAFQSRSVVWDALLALGLAYVEFARDNPGWFRLQFTHPVPQPDYTRTPARYAPLMHAALERELGAEDGGAAYRGLWGLAHGLLALVVEGLPIAFEDSLRLHVRALEVYARERRG